MPEHSTSYSAARLLAELADKGFSTDPELAGFISSQRQEPPIYSRILTAVGAFITSIFFIAFLALSDFIKFDGTRALITAGLIIAAGAIALQRIASKGHDVKHSFCLQFSFTMMVLAKTLCVIGVMNVWPYDWVLPLTILAVTAATYHIYPVAAERLLSVLAVTLFCLLTVLSTDDIRGYKELVFNSLFLLQFIGAAVLMTRPNIKAAYKPIADALALSLCFYVLYLIDQNQSNIAGRREIISPIFSNVVLAGGLLALCAWAAGGIARLKTEALVLTAAGIVLLGVISAPGILLTISLLVLGYAKHEKLMTIMGALFMPLFLWMYYYHMEVSLLQKSAILMGSGVVLLAARFYIQRRGFIKLVSYAQ